MLKLYVKLLATRIDKYKSDRHSVYKPIFGVKHDIQHSNSANSDLQQPQQDCFEITDPSPITLKHYIRQVTPDQFKASLNHTSYHTISHSEGVHSDVLT